MLGGTGWRPVEACVVAEELGRAQDGSAWLGTTIGAAALASAPGYPRQQLLPGLLAGTATAGVAIVGEPARIIRHDAGLDRTPPGAPQHLIHEQAGPVHFGKVLDRSPLAAFGQELPRRRSQQVEVDVLVRHRAVSCGRAAGRRCRA
ncbi:MULTISPECIES: acyl-CoA dehydrogenase family protein [unclassified Mycobacterium]|uniref:acyl-CoA dehydrogenase family protein n=1 Tax=Mycobacterium sp. E735 TaxID=1834148 RepID=UPI001E3B4638|nr:MULTISPECIES: acyl-CoA dehydrogenase family protein [unclassified Mycobacterium]